MIRILAALTVALNHLDLWTRRGLPHLKHEYPHRLGADVAGSWGAYDLEITHAFFANTLRARVP